MIQIKVSVMVEESKASLFPDILNSARSSAGGGAHNNSISNGPIAYDIIPDDDLNNLIVAENHSIESM